jgi:hypothetical protein
MLRSMSYFVPGLWHFASAMAFAVALGVLAGGDPTLWLRRAEFTIPLLIASSALFFIPDGLAKKGLMKFLHYPLPDWDVLLLGPASHRHWLTHSPILPILLVALAWNYPILLSNALPYSWFAAGLSVGIGSHLSGTASARARIKLSSSPTGWPYALRLRASICWPVHYSVSSSVRASALD